MSSLYMLDTDICSYIIKGPSNNLITQIKAHQNHLGISAITLAELLYGAAKRQSPRIFESIAAFQQLVEVIDWSNEAAAEYAELRVALEKDGNPIGNMDMMIAAAALAAKATLVTNNQAHFSRIKSLKIQNWT